MCSLYSLTCPLLFGLSSGGNCAGDGTGKGAGGGAGGGAGSARGRMNFLITHYVAPPLLALDTVSTGDRPTMTILDVTVPRDENLLKAGTNK